jgi:hypothetical protein
VGHLEADQAKTITSVEVRVSNLGLVKFASSCFMDIAFLAPWDSGPTLSIGRAVRVFFSLRQLSQLRRLPLDSFNQPAWGRATFPHRTPGLRTS